MLPENLLNYLKLAKGHNLSFVQIVDGLRGQGWDENALLEAQKWYESNQNVELPSGFQMRPENPHRFASTPDATPIAYSRTVAQSSNISQSTSSRSGGSRSRVAFIATFSIFLFLGLSSITLYMISYNRIQLPDKSLQKSISRAIVGLPFMPKTPDYVLENSMMVQDKVDRFTVDASFAITDPTIAQVAGVGSFDLSVKGPVDYSDPLNPAMSLNIAFAKDLELDLKIKNKKIYFKINKIPEMVRTYLTLYGIKDSFIQEFLNKWFYYEVQQLETEARKNLNTNNKSLTQKTVNALLEAITNKEFGSQIQLSDDEIDGLPMYKVNLRASKQTIDEIARIFTQYSDYQSTNTSPKPSQYIDRFIFDSWIDKKSYYVRKVSISFVIKNEESNTPFMPSTLGINNYSQFGTTPQAPKEIPVSIVINLTNYGASIAIEEPQDAVEFLKFYQETFLKSSGIAEREFARSNNTKRSSDVNALLNAINQYMADNNGSIPNGITTDLRKISSAEANICSALVPQYIAALPVDPSINNGDPVDMVDCSQNYDTGYTVVRDSATNRLTVSAPLAEDGKIISVIR